MRKSDLVSPGGNPIKGSLPPKKTKLVLNFMPVGFFNLYYNNIAVKSHGCNALSRNLRPI